MRTSHPLPLLALAAFVSLLAACGGGGGGGSSSSSTSSSSSSSSGSSSSSSGVQANPAWSAAITLDERNSLASGSLAADGSGAVAVLWRRAAQNGSGQVVTDQVAARLNPDGSWSPAEVVEAGEYGATVGIPTAAVDDQGRGWMMWFAEYGSGSSAATELRSVALDLKATTPWSPSSEAFIFFSTTGYGNLQVAVGSDGTARAAWDQPGEGSTGDMTTLVGTSRFGAGGDWETPDIPGSNAGIGMGLVSLCGDGKGGSVLELVRVNDLPMGEAHDYPVGGGAASGVPGWEPAAQATSAAHSTAWAIDGQGGMEAWLMYFSDSAHRTAWPRRKLAGGSWTVGDAVTMPRPAESLAVFREASGAGWLSGAGSEGIWVAPLSGLTLGSEQLLLAAPSLASELVGVRDASGRPALLWIQQRNGTVEGIGFSRLDGSQWTAPLILPGTAGLVLHNLHAAAGPGGIVATWEQGGNRTTLLRAALWR
jgi:hypothetical protein